MNNISFIILTWNSEKYIKRCIESINDNINDEKEIIIVDNGSIDNTRNIIKSYKKIRLIELNKNMGTTLARNIGYKISNTKYDYICFIDSDVAINKSFNILLKLLKSDKNIGLIAPFLYYDNGLLQKSFKKFPTIQQKLMKIIPIKKIQRIGEMDESYKIDTFINNRFFCVDYIISACWLLKRSVLNNIGLFDENIFYAPEDIDICVRMWQNNYKVVMTPMANAIHSTQRITRKKPFSKIAFLHLKGLIYYFYKYKYLINRNKLYNKIPYKKMNQ